MPRPLRDIRPNGWYHVMNIGACHRNIFIDDQDRFRFLQLLEAATGIHEIEIHAFCLMGNHFHLLVRCQHPNLDAALHRIMSMYVREFNKRHGRDGPLFRSRYHAILVETDPYLLAVTRYIHRNPLDLGVTDIESYQWSSLGLYSRRSRSRRWVSTDFTLEIFGTRKAYLSYVHSPFDNDVDRALSTKQPPTRIGPELDVPGTAA